MKKLLQKNLLRLMDLTSTEINDILALAAELKCQKNNGNEVQRLIGKNIALIFEKESTRTRCSFEVAAFDQGAHVTYLGPSGSQIGHKESIKDTARVLSMLYDGIQYRGYSQKIVETLANYASVPVWNGLTNEFHPTQLLADLLTMQQCLPETPLHQMKIVYIGDARNNISHTLLEAAALTGIDLRLVAPSAYWPDNTLVTECRKLAQQRAGSLTITEDIQFGIKNVDFIYTDVWVSMGEDKSMWEERMALLRSYQVSMEILRNTGNSQVKFMHCLPALHNDQTIIGKQIAKQYGISGGLEVTDEVFESPHSVVFRQVENRLHTIKAVMILTLV